MSIQVQEFGFWGHPGIGLGKKVHVFKIWVDIIMTLLDVFYLKRLVKRKNTNEKEVKLDGLKWSNCVVKNTLPLTT